MKPHTVLAAFLCLAACSLPAQAQSRNSGQSSSRNDLLTSPSSQGRSSSKSSGNNSGGRSIFDIAIRMEPGGKNGQVAPAAGRTSTSGSPFGTTSNRMKSSSSRRWKTNSKLADCIRDKAIPSNTNFTFSGTITHIVTDGRYTILTMFDSVSTTTENGAACDVPVTVTYVMDAEVAGNTTLKEKTKTFTVDSNYVYFVWNDSGCTVRAVDNSLTEPDPVATSATQPQKR